MVKRIVSEEFPFTVLKNESVLEIIYHRSQDTRYELVGGCAWILGGLVFLFIGYLLIPIWPITLWFTLPFAFILLLLGLKHIIYKYYIKGVAGIKNIKIRITNSHLFYGNKYNKRILLNNISNIRIIESDYKYSISHREALSSIKDNNYTEVMKKTYHLIIKTDKDYDEEIFKYVQNYYALNKIREELISFINNKD